MRDARTTGASSSTSKRPSSRGLLESPARRRVQPPARSTAGVVVVRVAGSVVIAVVALLARQVVAPRLAAPEAAPHRADLSRSRTVRRGVARAATKREFGAPPAVGRLADTGRGGARGTAADALDLACTAGRLADGDARARFAAKKSTRIAGEAARDARVTASIDVHLRVCVQSRVSRSGIPVRRVVSRRAAVRQTRRGPVVRRGCIAAGTHEGSDGVDTARSDRSRDPGANNDDASSLHCGQRSIRSVRARGPAVISARRTSGPRCSSDLPPAERCR